MIKNLIILFTIIISYSSSNAQEILIKNGDSWKYFDNGSLKNDWFKKTSTIKWKNGVTPLGYGDRKVTTNIYFGEDEEKKQITKYFSKNLIIEENKNYLAYEFKLQRDDGAIIYVNGKELYRDNLPNGLINGNTRAIEYIDNKEESLFNSKMFESDIFKVGLNTIAVEVHQSSEDSSDLIFSLELIAHNDTKILEDILSSKNLENLKLQNKITTLTSDLLKDKLNFKIDSLTNSNNSLKYILFILGFLLTLLFSVLLYLIYIFKRRENKLEKALDNETDIKTLREKEIIQLSTHLLHNKQYFKEIKADLNSIKTTDKSILKSINNQIDEILESDKDWENLKRHFNAINNGFYDELLKKHPELTETELRHCMFIKMHLQTKEIASILLIDPRSVQTARYRIKKKMQLDEKIDLRDYLLNI